MFFTYILYNPIIDKYYVGQTSNLDRRLYDHNRKYKSGKFTVRQLGEWKLVYVEKFTTRSESMQRESEIKNKKSRKYIEGLVKEQSR